MSHNTAATVTRTIVLATALANKLARIAWTVLAQGRSYEARVEPNVA
jgi:transposase